MRVNNSNWILLVQAVAVLSSFAGAEVDHLRSEYKVADWQARRIAFPAKEGRLDLEGATWIWGLQDGETGDKVALGPCLMSRTFTICTEAAIEYADLVVSADNSATVTLDDKSGTHILWNEGK